MASGKESFRDRTGHTSAGRSAKGGGKGGQGQRGVWGISVVSGAAEVEAGWAAGPHTALRHLTRPAALPVAPAVHGAVRRVDCASCPQLSQTRRPGWTSFGPKAAPCSAESRVTVDTPKGTVGATRGSQQAALQPLRPPAWSPDLLGCVGAGGASAVGLVRRWASGSLESLEGQAGTTAGSRLCLTHGGTWSPS